MDLKNKLGLEGVAFLQEEERISKQKAKRLFDEQILDTFEVGTYAGLQSIHWWLFDEIYDFAGQTRTMNIAHPFLEGNGRSTRIWLDAMLRKELGKVVDWSKVDREDYMAAMERSPVRDTEIRLLLSSALTDQIDDRTVYMHSIDASYRYEGYSHYKTENV